MLLIDSGNSAVKCRLIQQEGVTDRVFPVRHDLNLLEFTHFIQSIETDAVYLASVASEQISQLIIDLVRQHMGAVVQPVKTMVELGGLKNGYLEYTQLGVDRWLTLLAANDLINGDVVIVDAGSAITVDLLSKRKGHLGGAILAGFQTGIERFKQIFPDLDFNHPDIAQSECPGRSTAGCIHLMKEPVTVTQVIQLISRWSHLLDEPVRVLLCGQDATYISESLDRDYEVIPDLVFKGMLKQIELTSSSTR
jgi:type III pantothenate kinase